MYLLIVSLVMAAVGGAHLLFAFVQAPAALDSMLDGASRRVQFIVLFVPEARQRMVARLLTGLVMLLGSVIAAGVWIGKQG